MIKLDNYAREEEMRGDRRFYRWKVFVDEDQSILDQIEEVDYQLNPTFPQPEQTVRNPQDGFSLETAGWGEFTLSADIKFRDGRVETVAYWLDLGKEWPDDKDQ